MVVAQPAALNRKQRKALARRLRVEDPGLDVMHPHAAGIDVGNSAHYVAVRPDRDPDALARMQAHARADGGTRQSMLIRQRQGRRPFPTTGPPLGETAFTPASRVT